ncbi:T9SS type A sorting domain-containing protein [Flavobacterium chuncheonense]|uniref:T9SS type A sorting domain-containing protein n=1 Tax=Flavobacterium chuncheonense TaxID=2026653 RepID=A0ABW5YJ54_9FLAO
MNYKKLHFLGVLLLLFYNSITAQSVTATFSTGDISTNYNSFSSSCIGTLAVTLPAGQNWTVTGVDVVYNMTAANGAYKSEQRSRLYCQNTSVAEGSYSAGSGSSSGTHSYARSNLSIANGTFPGNTVVTFEMHAYRTWGGSGCNTTYSKVDDGTWTVTVHYEQPPSCPAPTALGATAVTAATANLGWTAGAAETLWDVEYGVSGFTPGSGTVVTGVTDTTYGIGSLLANTTYEFYVRADCGGGDWSTWSGPYAFTTLCAAVSEFTLNFDANTSLPACTQKSGTAGSVYVSSSYSQSAPNGLYIYSSGATYVLPRISNAEATTHRLKFAARSSASTTIRIGYMTNPSDPATFVVFQTVNTSTSFQQFVAIPNGAPASDSFLAIQATSNSSTYLDDVVWETIPAVPPTCVAITSPSNNQTNVNLTTSINWASQLEATGYKVYLGTAAGTYDVLNGQDVGNVTTYSLNGNLNYNTDYFAKIVPYNTFGEASACSEMMFTTRDGCVLPYTPVNGATAVAVNPTIQWYSYNGATAYEISIGTTAGGTDFLNAHNNGTATSYTASGLDYNTVYYVNVKAVGADEVTSAICANYSFTTKSAPQTVPYVQDFENTTADIVFTGTSTNKFFIGNATQNGGNKALYISNDNGISNAYTMSASSTAWATVEVDLTTATYVDLVFDWKALGESSYDYGEVYINTGGSDTRISGVKEFQGSDVFQTKRIPLSSYTGQIVVIKFKWVNDGSSGSNPPLAIDNLKVIDYVEYANGNWSNVSGPTVALHAYIADNITVTSNVETNDLTINAGQVVTVEPGVVVTVSGNLTNNGSVIFKSDATGTASFGTYNGAAIAGSGTVTTERYIGPRRAWRMLTAPVKGTSNNSVYANWQNDGVVNAGTGVDVWGPSGTGLHTGPAYSIKKYPTQSTATTWENVTNTMTEPLFDANKNNAFTVFVTGSYSDTPTTIASGADATVLSATGALITGDVVYANLPTAIHTNIGNPYASPIDPSALLSDSDNASNYNQLWVWDPELSTVGGYLVYDSVTGWSNTAASYSNTIPTLIQSGQAFFVKPASTANFNIKENHKGTTVDNGVFAKNNPVAQLRINLQQQNAGVWQPEDALVAAFYGGGENTITPKDAQKMYKGGVNIAFRNNQERLTVEHREPANVQDVLPMEITGMTAATNYRLMVQAQNYAGLQPYLWDSLGNTYYPIPTDGSVYEHVFTVNNVQTEAQRFQMVFNGAQLASETHALEVVKVYPNPITNGFCNVSLPKGTIQATYTVTSQLGQKIAAGTWRGTSGEIITHGWAAGIYHVNVKIEDAVYRLKISVQ